VDLADNSGLLAEDSELRDLQRKALLELAATRRHREDYANATDFARRADVLATNDDAKAAVRYEEGRIALDTGQSPEGEEKLQQALRLWDTLASGGYREEEAWALYALAEKRHVEKRHDEAIDLARQVLRLFRSANDAYGAANIHQRWGLYLRTKAELLDPRPGEDAAGTLREAKEHTDKAEAMAREHGFPLIEARAILERGFLACLDSDRHRADQCAETARRLFLNLDYARGLAQVERLCEKLRSP
jgi:tetratricopeptide (TPR) repeat protein